MAPCCTPSSVQETESPCCPPRHEPHRAQQDVFDDEKCSARCVEAAAAVECREACQNEDLKEKSIQGEDGSHETSQCHYQELQTKDEHDQALNHKHELSYDDSKLLNACSEHRRSAYEKYTSFLEQARCICRRVLADHSRATLTKKEPVAKSSMEAERSNSGSSCTTSFMGMPHAEVVYHRTAKRRYPRLSDAHSAGDAPETTRSVPIIDRGYGHDHSIHSHHCGGEHEPGPDANDDVIPDPQPEKSGRSQWMSRVPWFSRRQSTTPRDLEKGSGNYQPVTFSVSGMDCSSCGGILTRALSGTHGVQNVRVNFVGGSAQCEIATNITTIDQVIRHVGHQTRYTLTEKHDDFSTLELVIDAPIATYSAQNMPSGVTNVERSSKKQYQVTYDPSIIGPRKVLDSFHGSRLAPPTPDKGLSAGRKRLLVTFWSTFLAFCLTIPVVVLSWGDTLVSDDTVLYTSVVLGTCVQAIAVPEFYRPALSSLFFRHEIDLDMLVVISISAAYGYSIVAFGLLVSGTADDVETLFETSTLLISLVLLGRLVAAYARKRAVDAVSVKSIQPTHASLLTAGGEIVETDARLLELGDKISVRPHTYVVTDGVVRIGESAVNESMITGEAVPVPKRIGDTLIAGTLNEGGSLTIEVTRLPGRNTVTDIANLVEQAHATKPRVQDLADKVAGYFVPVVVTISIIVTIIWLVVDLKVRNKSTGAAIGNAITYGIAVLAVSCPCALGLAVPMVLVVAGGVAARLGVIIKTADATERAFKVTDVVFDKTGTLTEDLLEVVSETILERPTLSRSQIQALVKAMVAENSHPVSKAVSHSLNRINVTPPNLDKIESIPGVGVRCTWNGTVVRGGNAHWLECDQDPLVSKILDQGLAIYCIADASGVLAVYGVRTTLRTEAQHVVQKLQRRNINVHIVSGDGTKAVQTVARELRVPLEQAMSRQTPQDKQNYIRALRSESRIVLFCGDGTNDAVAVAEANVGVQIESSSEITRASADVVLLGSLNGVLQLLDMSKAAFRRITLNFVWSAIYNVFAILLAGGAFVKVRIPPAYAGLGELVSVLPVVVVAMTLLRRRSGRAYGDA